VRGHAVYAIPVLEHVPQRHRPIQDAVEGFDIGHALQIGQVEELPLQRLAIYLKLVRRQRIVQRDGGSIVERLADGVFVQIAARI